MNYAISTVGFVIAGLTAPFPSWQWLCIMIGCALVHFAARSYKEEA